MEVENQIRTIINNPNLNPTQKQIHLAQQADQLMDYPTLSEDAANALKSGLICDLFEGHAPYKPRYILPDYQKALANGCEYLELDPPHDLDEAINFLSILYQYVPSVTGLPVYLGNIDQLLLPFVDEQVSEHFLYKKIRLFWQYLDRTLPDAFMHANIGPTDNRVARTILKVDRDLKQATPNLTLKYDDRLSNHDELLKEAIRNIIACNKPHIANHRLISSDFPKGYGIASCYNSLPIGGGSHTLVRLNLAESFQKLKEHIKPGEDILAYYLQEIAPYCANLMFEIIQARVNYVVEQSGFFENHFLVKEKFIHLERFSAMFGVFGLAELVNAMMAIDGRKGRYGHNLKANEMGQSIISCYANLIKNKPMFHCREQRALFHSQSGISSDKGITEGTRVTAGEEPDTLNHILAILPMHQYFEAGISDIFNIDETIEGNPQALVEICQGALKQGLKIFTANVANRDLVRVTGYMIRRSDIEKYRQEGSRLNSTALGLEAIDNDKVMNRQVRTI